MLGGGFAFLNVKRVVRIERGRAPGLLLRYGPALRRGAFCCRWFEPRPEVRKKTVYFGLFGW